MSTTVVLGAQWGDEGKGKLADILANESQLCCRAQGGNNAGHTIVANGVTYDFHILPSGLVNPGCINVIGSGCVVHVPSFFKELEALVKHGLDTTDRIYISDRAHVVFDIHQLVDGLEEVELGGGNIGTTRKGIGPAYSSKMTRSGLRMCDLFDEEVFEQKLRRVAAGYQKRFGDLLKYDVEEEITRYKELRPKIAPYVVDQVPLLQSAKEKNAKILVEGANALMLDIDYGTYPFVTSSNTGLGGVITGLTLGWRSIKEVIGVVKAYTTRVGSGPFPTEQLNETGEKLQKIGHEGGGTDLDFSFSGTPPFEFTYTRSTNAARGKKSKVLEIRTEVSHEMSMRIPVQEEGTYEVVSIKDAWCSFARNDIEGLEKGSKQKLLQF